MGIKHYRIFHDNTHNKKKDTIRFPTKGLNGLFLNMKILLNNNGQVREFNDYDLATKIVESRKTKPIWEVIDMIVKLWEVKCQDEAKAVRINIDQYREDAIDKDYAQTKGGKQFNRRLLMALPRKLMLLIRTVYDSDELKMDSKFNKEFVKRYPNFRIGRKS